MEKSRKVPQSGRGVLRRRDSPLRDSTERSDTRLWHIARQLDRLEIRIDLEGQWLIGPVQIVRVVANALRRVLGRVVIPPRLLDIAITHERRVSLSVMFEWRRRTPATESRTQPRGSNSRLI